MGGRGSSSGGFAGGGVSSHDIKSTDSLVSAREHSQEEVDSVLTATRYAAEAFGVELNDLQVATLSGKKSGSVLAYYDMDGNLAVNRAFFNTAHMNATYDEAVARGFHPPRGSKSALEAVAAHEVGHKLTEEAGLRAGKGRWAIDSTALAIVTKASQSMGGKTMGDRADFMKRISGYAGKNPAEAVAEAYADVYSNGRKAKRESHAVVKELKSYFRRKSK